MKKLIFFYLSLLVCQHCFSQVREQTMSIFNLNGNQSEIILRMVADNAGNMYVGGSVGISESNRDFLLLKYSPLGSLEWYRTYDGSAHGVDTISGMTLDKIGNVYVTGYSQGKTNTCDATTLKYDNKGNLLWEARYKENPFSSSYGKSVLVDGNLNVYIAGHTFGDCLLIKYDSEGKLVWVVKEDGSSHSYDEGYVMSFSQDQKFIYLGCCLDEIDGGHNFVVLKYNSMQGELFWKTSYDGIIHDNDYIVDMKTDNLGFIYVGGTSMGTNSHHFSDIMTIKLNENGVILWDKRYDGLGEGEDWVNYLKLDNDNNVYMCGGTQGLNFLDSNYNSLKERNDAYVIKYNSAGDFQWISTYDGPNHFHDCCQDFDIDEDQNVYMVGRTSVLGMNYRDSDNLFTMKLDKFGNRIWIKFYDGIEHKADYGSGIIYNKISKAVFSAGRTRSETTDYDAILLKYTEMPQRDVMDNINTSNLKNYPNPFNPSTQIQFTIPKDDFVKLSVYDLSGRLVRNLIEGYETAGNHQIIFDGSALSSGVYFYTLQTSSERITNKFILNK